jgi:hypothetical protein
MKKCIRCGTEKDISMFHKHKEMKDGHLNKCKTCVVSCISEWRKQNPEVRKIEHEKNRIKLGKKTRKQYLEDRAKNAKGRKTVNLEHSHKRRMQKERHKSTELDSFVFEEAVRLKDLRKEKTKIVWHIDHIVPLNHKDACGLHNSFNLQVVPAKWNLKKSNKNMDTYFCKKGY